MTITGEYINSTTIAIATKKLYECLNGPLTNKELMSHLYHNTNDAYITIKDPISKRQLFEIKIEDKKATIKNEKGLNNKINITHPWDICSRLEGTLNGWLNLELTIEE